MGAFLCIVLQGFQEYQYNNSVRNLSDRLSHEDEKNDL